MFLIIFTGLPASGKSSIATIIAQDLSIPYYSKDDYKISLYEKYGFKSHDEKRKLGLLSEEMLMEQIRNSITLNCDIIIDNNFKDFEEIKKMKTLNKKCKIVCINLVANPNLLAKRYNQRIESGNRHPALYTLDIYPIINGVSSFHKKLDGKDVVRLKKNITEEMFGDYIFEISTDNLETQFDLIVECVKEKIQKYIGRQK